MKRTKVVVIGKTLPKEKLEKLRLEMLRYATSLVQRKLGLKKFLSDEAKKAVAQDIVSDIFVNGLNMSKVKNLRERLEKRMEKACKDAKKYPSYYWAIKMYRSRSKQKRDKVMELASVQLTERQQLLLKEFVASKTTPTYTFIANKYSISRGMISREMATISKILEEALVNG